jgi:hypothetical protein
MRPETMMERAVPRRAGSAMSPTSGRNSWGLIVVKPVRKDRAEKTWNDDVTQRPSH